MVTNKLNHNHQAEEHIHLTIRQRNIATSTDPREARPEQGNPVRGEREAPPSGKEIST